MFFPVDYYEILGKKPNFGNFVTNLLNLLNFGLRSLIFQCNTFVIFDSLWITCLFGLQALFYKALSVFIFDQRNRFSKTCQAFSALTLMCLYFQGFQSLSRPISQKKTKKT